MAKTKIIDRLEKGRRYDLVDQSNRETYTDATYQRQEEYGGAAGILFIRRDSDKIGIQEMLIMEEDLVSLRGKKVTAREIDLETISAEEVTKVLLYNRVLKDQEEEGSK